MQTKLVLIILSLLTNLALGACSHVGRVALLSSGDLEGKTLTALPNGPILEGEDCLYQHHLSAAFRNATAGTAYDTLVDVEVTTKTGIFVWSNCIQVKGKGLKSAELQRMEGLP